jgi:hypothetical protein
VYEVNGPFFFGAADRINRAGRLDLYGREAFVGDIDEALERARAILDAPG